MLPVVKPLTLAVVASLASLPAFAGKAVVETAEGEKMMMEYDPYGSRNVRMGMPGDDESYMLVNDGILYFVSNEDGELMVMNATSMMQSLGPSMAQMTPPVATEELVSIEPTGRDETVAGIKGEVYVATTRTENGKETTRELVLSDDDRAVEFMQGMMSFAEAGMEIVGEQAFEEETTQTMQRFLDMEQLGLLRAGDDFIVTELSGERIADSRFALPAEPMDLPNMGGLGGLLGGGGLGGNAGGATAAGSNEKVSAAEDEEEKGGLFSGMMEALGGKAERQAEDAGDRVDRNVDRRTDRAVDSAIDKAFDKLFGN